MLFKDLKQNYPVFVFDKQNLTYTPGKVVSVSFPHIDNANPMGMGKTVVDVVIEAGGKSATYAIPENMSIAYAGDIVLSTEREGIVREIEAMKSTSEQALKNVDRHKQIIEKSITLLAELNPAYKEKQENEQRFGKIENSISEIKEMMSSLMKEFKS